MKEEGCMSISNYFFTRKLIKIYFPNSDIESIDPIDQITVKLISMCRSLLKNKKFKHINNNKIVLYDCALFITYVVRQIALQKKFLAYEQLKKLDCELNSSLISGFEMFFRCSEIRNIETTVSRFDFYDEIFDENNEDFTSAITSVYNEFIIIVKFDIINKRFLEFGDSSPLYLLATLEDNLKCENECKYILNFALQNFQTEIQRFIYSL